LWQYLQSILSYITPPVVVVFLGGIFWARGTPAAGFWTLAAGIPLGVLGWIGNEVLEVSDLQFLYAAGVMFVLSALLFVGVSLVTPAPAPERLRGLVWRPQARGDDESSGVAVAQEGPGEVAPPWYLDFRALATGLLLAAGVLVVWWW
jgi:SSS family solute:Na+ symporter